MVDCDGKLCIYPDSAQNCTGSGYEGGERETYRAVDLNGERAVIDLVLPDEAINPALAKEARAVFDSSRSLDPTSDDRSRLQPERLTRIPTGAGANRRGATALRLQ